MPKVGFILAPNSRVAGSLVLNREIFKALNESGLSIEALLPDTDKFYQISLIGSLLNYFTLYRMANKYQYIIGTSFATLPFVNSSTKIVQQFHSTDTGSYLRVLENIKKQNLTDSKIMNKWVKAFKNLFTEQSLESIKLRLQIAQSTESACAKKAIKIIAVSPSVKEEIVKNFQVNPSKVKVILNGISDLWFDNFQGEINKPEIFFISRANSTLYTYLEKGLDRALEIFGDIKLSKKIIFHFGTSSHTFANQFKRKFSSYLKENDKFYSNLSHEEIKKLYKKGGIFLQTSRTEACQLTLLEAMACGMVPISYPVGIASQVIVNGKNGYIVNSTQEASDIINTLVKDRKELIRMGEESCNIVKRSFRFNNMINQYKKEIANSIKMI